MGTDFKPALMLVLKLSFKSIQRKDAQNTEREETLPAQNLPANGPSVEVCTGSRKEYCSQGLSCPQPAESGCHVSPQTTRRIDTATEETTGESVIENCLFT